MKSFSEFIAETKVGEQDLKDIRQASLIPWSSKFKDNVQKKIKSMTPDELEYVLNNVRWQPKNMLFKAWIQAVLKSKES